MKFTINNLHIGGYRHSYNDSNNGEILNSNSYEFEGLDGSFEFEISAEEVIKQGDQLISLVEKLMPSVEKLLDKAIDAKTKMSTNRKMTEKQYYTI